MATVGELIKTAREAIRPKMSQDDLARLIGVSRASVSAWETNKDVPRHTKHNLLSKILGLPLEAFSPPTAARVNGTEPDSRQSPQEPLTTRNFFRSVPQVYLDTQV
jgi:DNA-binding XRE family transcriptional regulator